MITTARSSRPARRQLLATAALAATALALTGCGAGSTSGAAADGGSATAGTAQEPGGGADAVRIGYFPLVHTSSLVHAEEAGYLEENGITAELVQTQGGAAAIPALASGDVDITYTNYTSALLAAQKGLPVVMIAGNDIGAEDHGIFVDPDSGIKGIEDLKGKSFAVNNLQNIGTVAILSQLEEAGIGPQDVDILEMPYPDMAAAVENGNVDAIWQVEPFQALSEDAGLVKIGDLFTGPAEDMPVAGWVATKAFAEENPEVIAGLQSSLTHSMDDLSGDRTALEELVPTFTTVSEEVAKQIELPKFSAELDLEQLQRGADLMLKYELIKEPLDVQGAAFDR
jgi:ABC-type nitrate/sulfonate/bicarbonate transport system substrate-binding protein